MNRPGPVRVLAAPGGGGPPDEGDVLCAIARNDGTEFRVTVRSYNGHQFATVGPWSPGNDGQSWWPVRGKTATVRVAELRAAAVALARAANAILGAQPTPRGVLCRPVENSTGTSPPTTDGVTREPR